MKKVNLNKPFNNYVLFSDGTLVRRFKKGDTVIKGTNVKQGKRIILRNKNRRKQVYLHRLLAEYFIPNKKNAPYVVFKDGDKNNLSLDNLTWSFSPKFKARHFYTAKQNKQILNANNDELVKLASDLGVSNGAIRSQRRRLEIKESNKYDK